MLGRPIAVNLLAARSQADRTCRARLLGLVARGPDGTLIPGLAASWSADATGKSWTFTLRPDARWHDGTPGHRQRRRLPINVSA